MPATESTGKSTAKSGSSDKKESTPATKPDAPTASALDTGTTSPTPTGVTEKLEDARKAGENGPLPAEERAGVSPHAATRGGFMDQMSRRSDADALEGHFVNIDLSDKDVEKEYARVFPEDRFPNGHLGSYGVYLEPLERDSETGIPKTIVVRLRDETNARVVVPYSAVRPGVAGGR
jgi:hypothetical protein